MVAHSVDTAMTTKDYLQLGVSLVAPFVAAGVALWIATLQQRERVSSFITWGYGPDYGEFTQIGIHNRSSQPIAITDIGYLYGVVFRTRAQGTALDYEDPLDLGFPYVVEPGEIRRLKLDEEQARRLANKIGFIRRFLARVFRRSRILIQCKTSTGARYRTSAEKALPWDEQLPWKRL